MRLNMPIDRNNCGALFHSLTNFNVKTRNFRNEFDATCWALIICATIFVFNWYIMQISSDNRFATRIGINHESKKTVQATERDAVHRFCQLGEVCWCCCWFFSVHADSKRINLFMPCKSFEYFILQRARLWMRWVSLLQKNCSHMWSHRFDTYQIFKFAILNIHFEWISIRIFNAYETFNNHN